MTEFKEIKTQEEFDERIKERIERVENKYSDYVSPNDYQSKIEELNRKYKKEKEDYINKFDEYIPKDELNSRIEESTKELNSKIATYERDSAKIKIAYKEGLPFEFIDRIRGDNEEEIIKDVKILKGLVGVRHKSPMARNEPNLSEEDLNKRTKENELKDLAKKLFEK